MSLNLCLTVHLILFFTIVAMVKRVKKFVKNSVKSETSKENDITLVDNEIAYSSNFNMNDTRVNNKDEIKHSKKKNSKQESEYKNVDYSNLHDNNEYYTNNKTKRFYNSNIYDTEGMNKALEKNTNTTQDTKKMLEQNDIMTVNINNEYDSNICNTQDIKKMLEQNDIMTVNSNNEYDSNICNTQDIKKMLEQNDVMTVNSNNEYDSNICNTQDIKKMLEQNDIMTVNSNNEYDSNICNAQDIKKMLEQNDIMTVNSNNEYDSNICNTQDIKKLLEQNDIMTGNTINEYDSNICNTQDIKKALEQKHTIQTNTDLQSLHFEVQNNISENKNTIDQSNFSNVYNSNVYDEKCINNTLNTIVQSNIMNEYNSNVYNTQNLSTTNKLTDNNATQKNELNDSRYSDKSITNIKNDSKNEANTDFYDILQKMTLKNAYDVFTNLKVTFKEFIENLPVLDQKNIKKVLLISYKINVDEYLELTTEKDRNIRYISTLCSLNRIKTLCLQSKLVDKSINVMYIFNYLYPVRTKDVFVNIRCALCEYLIEFIIISDYFYDELSYLTNFMKDKKDSVRKKAIKGCIKLIEFACNKIQKNNKNTNKETENLSNHNIDDQDKNLDMLVSMNSKQKKVYNLLNQMFTKNKKYLLNMLENDKSLQNTVQDLLTSIHKYFPSFSKEKNSIKMLNKKELNKMLQNNLQKNTVTNVIDKLFATENGFDFDSIKKIELSKKNAKEFLCELQNEESFEKYHKLIPIMCKNVNQEIFELIKKYKGNVEYTKTLVESLCYENNAIKSNVCANNNNTQNNSPDMCKNFDNTNSSFESNVICIIEYLHDILYKFDDSALINSIFMFFKMHENECNSKILYYLENMKMKKNENLLKHAIKFFDVSDSILKNPNVYNFEEKILAYFWKVTNSDFYDLEKFCCEIKNTQDFVVACNYLVFCYENVKKYGVLYENFEFCYDGISAMKMVYDKIKIETVKYIDRSKVKIDNKTNTNDNAQQFDVKQKLEELKNEIKNKKNSTNNDRNHNLYEPAFIQNYLKIAHIVNTNYELIYFGSENEIINCLKLFSDGLQNSLCFSFFDYIHENNFDEKKITSISRFFGKKIKKIDVAQKIVDLISNTNLYDSCFLHFVKFLDNQQCEIILSKITNKKTSRFVKSLMKKVEFVCRSSPVIEKKEVYKL